VAEQETVPVENEEVAKETAQKQTILDKKNASGVSRDLRKNEAI
jgi:hypothetical protein